MTFKHALVMACAAAACCAPARAITFDSFQYQGNDDYYNQRPLGKNEFYNPVIAGWNSDPSVCRVGNDYWLVTSTFGYYPGVPLYHSTDLAHWELVRNILDRPSQLDGLGKQSLDKGGIYAPQISYNPTTGLFYMITTDVGRKVPHFYVTAKDPRGEWSEPVWLNGIDGIDPSFFFDDNGKSYIVYKEDTAGRPRWSPYRCIRFIEFDPLTGNTVGESWTLNEEGASENDKFDRAEGPHIYKTGGFYYLLTAEGGTSTQHSANIYRADNIMGPWRRSGRNPILTQRNLKDRRTNPVTCAGHADMVQTPEGDWWAVFLACRPGPGKFQALGRETFIMPVRWSNDGWPYITQGEDTVPHVMERKGVAAGKSTQSGNFEWSDDFSTAKLRPEWLSLRGSAEKFYRLDGKQLTIIPAGIKSTEKPTPAYLGRRIQHHKFTASTCVASIAENGERGGMLIVKNEGAQYFFAVEPGAISLIKISRKGNETLATETLDTSIPVELKITSDGESCTFSYSHDGAEWNTVADGVDASHFCCERTGGFTGATIGLYAEEYCGTDALLKLRDERKRHPRIESLTFPGTTKWREAYDAVYGHGAMVENPWAAFRVYFNESQSVDLYLKTRHGLEIDQTCFYTSEQQLAEGWGQDVLLVGKSIGCGSFRGWDGAATVSIDSVASRTQRVISDNAIEIIDKGWHYNGHKIDMVQRYSVDAATPWLNVEITLSGQEPDDVFCTGVQRLDFDSKQMQNIRLDIEVAPDNVVSTAETQLDRLTLVKPDANGKIKYRVKGYYTEN